MVGCVHVENDGRRDSRTVVCKECPEKKTVTVIRERVKNPTLTPPLLQSSMNHERRRRRMWHRL